MVTYLTRICFLIKLLFAILFLQSIYIFSAKDQMFKQRLFVKALFAHVYQGANISFHQEIQK